MSSWPKDELRKIAETDDLHFSPFREDGVTVWNADICPKLLADFSLRGRQQRGRSLRSHGELLRIERCAKACATHATSFELDGGVR